MGRVIFVHGKSTEKWEGLYLFVHGKSTEKWSYICLCLARVLRSGKGYLFVPGKSLGDEAINTQECTTMLSS